MSYTAVIIQSETQIINKKEDVRNNLNRHFENMDFAAWFTKCYEYPLRLIAFPEHFLQGVVFKETREEIIANRALTVPGEETDRLGEKAKQYNTYITGTAWCVEPDWPDRIFHICFAIGPNGKVILKYYKIGVGYGFLASLFSPHDIYDDFVKKFGDGLDAFFPVADTEIGKIGMTSCYDGYMPEIYRGLVMNGAEVILRPTSWFDPWIGVHGGLDWWSLQARMRALDNNCYIIAPNTAEFSPRISAFPKHFNGGGDSLIVDYRGRILSRASTSGETIVPGIINIEQLRDFRKNAEYPHFTLIHLRTELFQKIYEKPIWPKNLWLKKLPETAEEFEEASKIARKRLQERGIII